MLRSSPPVAGAGAGRLVLAAAIGLLTLPALARSPAPQPEALRGLEVYRPAPPWMGIRAAPGVHVQEVVEGGPADKAGLKKGDLITSVDFLPTFEEPGLMGALREKGPGDVLVLDILRDGEDVRLKLVLGEFPADLLKERQEALAKQSPGAPPAPAPRPGAPDLPRLPGSGAVMRPLGEAERAFLGVTLQELSSGLAVYLGLPADSAGVLVERVHEDSPAETAGLEAGDVLLAVDDEPLRAMTELGEVLRSKSPGDAVALKWWSVDEDVQSASVELGARKKQIWAVSPPDDADARMREEVRESLKARLRMLEEQSRRLESEQSSVRRSLEELVKASKR
jgi:S1-C subfamily serine protease